MKVLVVLSLLAFAAAKPQFLLPYTAPLVTPTVKASEDTPVISTYTASYPYGGFPLVQAAGLPYNYRFPFSPVVTSVESSRPKRDADAEADPSLVYTTGLTGSTIINYPVTGFSAAVSPFNTLPYTGLNPYTGLSPYNYRFPFSPVVTSVESSRTKRDADPEADPSLVYTTGLTGSTTINYPVAGFPAAVSPFNTLPYTGISPYTGLNPYTGLSPYTTFPFLPVVSTAEAATPKEDSAVARAKRSADSSKTTSDKSTPISFTYPFPSPYSFPSPYAGLGYRHPTVLSYPLQHGTYPIYGK